MVGGLYSWHRVFDGETAYYDDVKDRLGEYDIVFVTMSNFALSSLLLSRIRKRLGWDSKTKLVTCVDYAPELWQENYSSVRSMGVELDQVDMVIVAEPIMESHLKVITDRPTCHINHPCNIDALLPYKVPIEKRRQDMVGMLHQYNRGWLSLFLATKDLPWRMFACVPRKNDTISKLPPYFRWLIEYRDYTSYIEWVADIKLAVDSYHIIHSYGRMAAENAVLSIPTVGASCVYSQQLLWPDLTIAPGDVYAQRQLIIRLYEDSEFYRRCCDKAWGGVQGCSYKNSKQAFLDALDKENDNAEIEIQSDASHVLP